MSFRNCTRCGKETGEGDLYCPECQAALGARKPRRLWLFTILFSGLLLFLTGLLIWHGGMGNWIFSFGSRWAKPAAVINGEAISQAEFTTRMNGIQFAIERQYGKNIFGAERGRALLEELEGKVLDGILNERLVAQEARKLKIAVPDRQIEEEIQKIAKEIYESGEKLEARLREDGISEKELKNHIRTILLYNAVKAAKTRAGEDPDISFSAWLMQARQSADMAIYAGENRKGNAPPLMGGCCAPDAVPGGPAGPSRSGSGLDPRIESEAKKVALDAYYKANPSEKEVTAKVTNYGCHIQVDIQKVGRIIKSYIYQDGKVLENS